MSGQNLKFKTNIRKIMKKRKFMNKKVFIEYEK